MERLSLCVFVWFAAVVGGCGGTDDAPFDSGAGGGAQSSGAAVGSAPTAQINHPGDGETRQINVDIPFVGVGTDPEDGTLIGAALVWTSSLEGQFGTGAQFSAQLTKVGTHTITLTVTDSDKNVATNSRTLILQP